MSELTVEVTDDNFEQEVLEADQKVLAEFWAAWCGPCKMVEPVLEELAEEYEDKVKVAKINVDENQNLARKYQVNSIPNLIFFKDGELVDQMVGFAGKEPLESKIKSL